MEVADPAWPTFVIFVDRSRDGGGEVRIRGGKTLEGIMIFGT